MSSPCFLSICICNQILLFIKSRNLMKDYSFLYINVKLNISEVNLTSYLLNIPYITNKHLINKQITTK